MTHLLNIILWEGFLNNSFKKLLSFDTEQKQYLIRNEMIENTNWIHNLLYKRWNTKRIVILKNTNTKKSLVPHSPLTPHKALIKIKSPL